MAALPETLNRRPRGEAERSHRQRAAVCDVIATYAATWAGTNADLDPALEAAAVEHLLDEGGDTR